MPLRKRAWAKIPPVSTFAASYFPPESNVTASYFPPVSTLAVSYSIRNPPAFPAENTQNSPGIPRESTQKPTRCPARIPAGFLSGFRGDPGGILSVFRREFFTRVFMRVLSLRRKNKSVLLYCNAMTFSNQVRARWWRWLPKLLKCIVIAKFTFITFWIWLIRISCLLLTLKSEISSFLIHSHVCS